MIRIIVLILILFVCHTSFAQEGQTDTPAVEMPDTVVAEKVQKAFAKQFPKIKLEEWVKENGVYTITFYDDNKWFDISYTEKGEWLESSIIIDYEDLPDDVSNAYEKSAYKNREVYIVTEVDRPEENKIYRLLIDDIKEDEIEIEFDVSGKLLKG